MPRATACALCEDGIHQSYPVRLLSDGRRVRVRLCLCGRVTDITPAETPGLCCPKCGDVRVLAFQTRNRRPGVAGRLRKCHFCGNVAKTAEQFVSASV